MAESAQRKALREQLARVEALNSGFEEAKKNPVNPEQMEASWKYKNAMAALNGGQRRQPGASGPVAPPGQRQSSFRSDSPVVRYGDEWEVDMSRMGDSERRDYMASKLPSFSDDGTALPPSGNALDATVAALNGGQRARTPALTNPSPVPDANALAPLPQDVYARQAGAAAGNSYANGNEIWQNDGAGGFNVVPTDAPTNQVGPGNLAIVPGRPGLDAYIAANPGADSDNYVNKPLQGAPQGGGGQGGAMPATTPVPQQGVNPSPADLAALTEEQMASLSEGAQLAIGPGLRTKDVNANAPNVNPGAEGTTTINIDGGSVTVPDGEVADTMGGFGLGPTDAEYLASLGIDESNPEYNRMMGFEGGGADSGSGPFARGSGGPQQAVSTTTPQQNFERRIATGEPLSPREIRQANSFAQRMPGYDFDSERGYVPTPMSMDAAMRITEGDRDAAIALRETQRQGGGGGRGQALQGGGGSGQVRQDDPSFAPPDPEAVALAQSFGYELPQNAAQAELVRINVQKDQLEGIRTRRDAAAQQMRRAESQLQQEAFNQVNLRDVGGRTLANNFEEARKNDPNVTLVTFLSETIRKGDPSLAPKAQAVIQQAQANRAFMEEEGASRAAKVYVAAGKQFQQLNRLASDFALERGFTYEPYQPNALNGQRRQQGNASASATESGTATATASDEEADSFLDRRSQQQQQTNQNQGDSEIPGLPSKPKIQYNFSDNLAAEVYSLIGGNTTDSAEEAMWIVLNEPGYPDSIRDEAKRILDRRQEVLGGRGQALVPDTNTNIL